MLVWKATDEATSPVGRSRRGNRNSRGRDRTRGRLSRAAQAVLFGIGMVLILATPLSDGAMTLVPWMIGTSVSAPLAWLIAPRLQLRYWHRRHANGDLISG